MSNLSNDVSLIGVCNGTAYAWSDSISMDVPSFTEKWKYKTLLISKSKDLDHCSVKAPYFFSSHGPPDDNINYDTTSGINVLFGRHRFCANIVNEGTFTMKRENPEHSGTTLLISGEATERIDVNLEAIRGATEKL